jgi:hypothetical protein
MTVEASAGSAEPDWEYAPLRIPAEVTQTSAAVQLSVHAEFGGWELARTLRFADGSRKVVLRRRRRPAMPGAGGSPLPGWGR